MVYVTFECSPEFKARLEDAAKADQRSMSSQIRVMLSDWMKNVKESPWLNRAGSEPTRRSSIVERIEGPAKKTPRFIDEGFFFCTRSCAQNGRFLPEFPVIQAGAVDDVIAFYVFGIGRSFDSDGLSSPFFLLHRRG